MKVFLYSTFAFAVLTFTFACNDVSLVGSDLFVPDSIDLIYEDDFEINGSTVRVDSVLTYDGSASLTTFIVGELEDPVFGNTNAEAFIDLRYGSTGVGPDFRYDVDGTSTKVTLDSVVLVLEYNEDGFYGDTNAVHNIEIRVMDNPFPEGEEIYSTTSFASTEVIGTKSFVPSPNDSLFIMEPGDSTATGVANQLRIRLNEDWAQAMIDDTSLVNSAEKFLDYAPGLHILSSPESSSTMGFNFGTRADGTSALNSIYVYYSEGDEPQSYRFSVNGKRHNYYEHNYEDAEILPFIGDESLGDSLLFIQGMAGVSIELELPVLTNDELDDFVLNKMELEFFVKQDETFDIHDPVEDLIIQYYDDDGELMLIEDAKIAFETGLLDFFDGVLSTPGNNGTNLYKYTTVFSIHAISQLDSDNPSALIRIAPRNKPLIPNRSIIFGPGHSMYPMKLKANYSN